MRLARLVVCCLLVVVATSVVQAATAPGSIQVRVGSLATPGTPWVEDLQVYARDLSEASHGLIKAKIIQAANASTEPAIIRAAQKGDPYQLIGVSSASLVEQIPALEVLELPFLFDSPAETDYVIDNFLTEPVRKLLRAKGLEFFCWAENGWLSIATRDRVVKTPKDLVGLRMRSQPSAMHIMAWETYGATPVPLQLQGVVPALTSGDVAGFAQTVLLTLAEGWAKKIHHVTLLHHIYQPLIVAFSKTFFDAQPENVQKIFLEHSSKYAVLNRKNVRAMEAALVSQLTDMGVDVYTPKAAEREAFVQASRRIQDKFVNTAPPEALALLKVVVQGKAAFAKLGKP